MTPEFSVEMLKALMFQALSAAAPFLVSALVVGLAVSLFQAVTSINEQTLTFVPKALVVTSVLAVLLPWMLRRTMEFTIAIFEKIPEMAL